MKNWDAYRCRAAVIYSTGSCSPLFYCSTVLGKICTAAASKKGKSALNRRPATMVDTMMTSCHQLVRQWLTGGGESWEKCQICFQFTVRTQFFTLNPNLAFVLLSDNIETWLFPKTILYLHQTLPLLIQCMCLTPPQPHRLHHSLHKLEDKDRHCLINIWLGERIHHTEPIIMLHDLWTNWVNTIFSRWIRIWPLFGSLMLRYYTLDESSFVINIINDLYISNVFYSKIYGK